jgi:hypothetical protein
MTVIQKIEHLVGKVTSYDGNFCCWALGRPHDLRDILRNVKGLSLAEAQEALEQADAEASKARKAAIRAAKESKE